MTGESQRVLWAGVVFGAVLLGLKFFVGLPWSVVSFLSYIAMGLGVIYALWRLIQPSYPTQSR